MDITILKWIRNIYTYRQKDIKEYVTCLIWNNYRKLEWSITKEEINKVITLDKNGHIVTQIDAQIVRLLDRYININ